MLVKAILKSRSAFTAIAILFGTSVAIVGYCVSSEAKEPLDAEIFQAQNSQEANLIETVHQQLNQYRKSQNLPPLNLNAAISQQAEIHSQNMAQQTVEFGHHGFKARIKALSDRISYGSAAENVAHDRGYDNPAARAVAGWLDSKRHRQNIVGDYNLTGIGVAKNQQGEYYFTQIFIQD